MCGEVLFTRMTNDPRFEAENSASKRGFLLTKRKFDKSSNCLQNLRNLGGKTLGGKTPEILDFTIKI